MTYLTFIVALLVPTGGIIGTGGGGVTNQTTVARMAAMQAAGALIYDTDLRRLFVGDGATFGGVEDTRVRYESTITRTAAMWPAGVLVWDSDLASLWVGDGATLGGVAAGGGGGSTALSYDPSGAVPVMAWTPDTDFWLTTGSTAPAVQAEDATDWDSERASGRTVVRFTDNYKNYLDFDTLLGKPGNWTVMVAFRARALGTIDWVCGSSNSSTSATMWGGIRINAAGSLYYIFGDGVSFSYGETTANVITARQWHVVTASYTSGDDYVRIYVDGGAEEPVTKHSTAATTTAGTAYRYAIGRNGNYNGNYFDGSIGAVWVWDSALNAADRVANETIIKATFGIP